jgi:serine/threonine protein kinase
MEIEDLLDRRYRIEEQLVEAGTGTVYRARDLQLDCDVAVKVVSPGRVADATALERYRRDIAVASRLRHPNLVPILRVGEADGTHYTVMELVVGSSLRSGMGVTMSPRQVVHIVRQVLDGLREGHQAGLVHGGLSADTILLARNTTGRELPRIAGFGAAALQPHLDSDSAPALLEFESTRDFLAPEQLRGDAIDFRTDLFAVGVLAYALLCGAMPFGATSDNSISAVDREAVPMSKRAPWINVDPLLEAFAHWLMQRSSALRPASAAEATRVLDLIACDRGRAAIELRVTDTQKTMRLELIAAPKTMPVEPHKTTRLELITAPQKTMRLELISAPPAAPTRAASESGDTGYELVTKRPRKAGKSPPFGLIAAGLVVVLLVTGHPRGLLRSIGASDLPAAMTVADITPMGTISHHIAVGIEVHALAQRGVAPELVASYQALQLYDFLDSEADRVYIAGVLTDLDREARAITPDQ